jgi:hypothetical protein
MRLGCTFCSSRRATRRIRAYVLPVPGPATTRSCEPVYAAMFNGVPDKLVFQGIVSHQFIFRDAFGEFSALSCHDYRSHNRRCVRIRWRMTPSRNESLCVQKRRSCTKSRARACTKSVKTTFGGLPPLRRVTSQSTLKVQNRLNLGLSKPP